jgi:hypothetical protein
MPAKTPIPKNNSLNPEYRSGSPYKGTTKQQVGHLKKSRNEISRLHNKPEDVNATVDSGIQKASKSIAELADTTLDTGFQSVKGLWQKLSGEVNNLDNPDSKQKIFLKKALLGIATGGFFIFGAKSALDFFASFFGRAKGNVTLKFLDSAFKLSLGFLTFRTLTNSPGNKLKNLNQVLLAIGLSFGVNQLSNFSSGEKNILARIANATGSGAHIRDFFNWFDIMPIFSVPKVDNRNNINL